MGIDRTFCSRLVDAWAAQAPPSALHVIDVVGMGDGSNDDDNVTAVNAAQLYYAAGLYADGKDPALAVSYYNRATDAAELSQQLLADNDSSFTAGSETDMRINRRFRFERARIIADYIASMTDRYAIIEHQRLFDLAPTFKKTPGF